MDKDKATAVTVKGTVTAMVIMDMVAKPPAQELVPAKARAHPDSSSCLSPGAAVLAPVTGEEGGRVGGLLSRHNGRESKQKRANRKERKKRKSTE